MQTDHRTNQRNVQIALDVVQGMDELVREADVSRAIAVRGLQ